ncbi:hypothetical protein MVEN_02202500 [Mycena venus]|uniref:Uncharacterized protein n=1 Tax=Mycena venus TaxID=2733690 RepID=A0A8H6X6K9_9AGAR|nr:hypothetical protein MVEN_02202500 [Mycena venus]
MADPAVLSLVSAKDRLRTFALGQQYQFPQTTADTAQTTNNAEAERLARRGNLFSHLILFYLLREEIPASSYDGAEAIIEAFSGEVQATLSRPATACFQTAFGIETYLKTHDALASNFKVCIPPGSLRHDSLRRNVNPTRALPPLPQHQMNSKHEREGKKYDCIWSSRFPLQCT